MSKAVFFESDKIEINKTLILQLKEMTVNSKLRKSRFCLHKDHNDLIQEMVIGMCKGVYVAPHRQINKNKSYQIIEGELKVLFFDDSGTITQQIVMGTQESGKTFIFRFPSNQWHTIEVQSEIVIYVEVMTGPFTGTEFASWGIENTRS